MFKQERKHSVVVNDITRPQIWAIWKDVNQWHTWDHDIEWAKIDGEFATGRQFQLKPKGGPKVDIELQDVRVNTGFTDFCTFPLAHMYSIHEMHDLGTAVEVTHVVRIEGLLAHLWWFLVGKKVATGMPEQTKAMLAKARESNGKQQREK